jgi:adenosylhomocysteine nucleosidase
MKKLRVISLVLLSLLFMSSCASVSESKMESSATVETTKPLGIMSAMDVELNYLLSQADIKEVVSIGGNDFNVATLEGQDVVIVKAGVGKSLSAAATAILCNEFNVSSIIFTGIAGGVAPEVEIADVVISTSAFFHDYGYLGNDNKIDLNTDFVSKVDLKADSGLEKEAYTAAVQVLGEDRVFEGAIATGDQFMANKDYVDYLYNDYNTYAVEMEGACVAYVASKYDVPFVLIRSLSDKADGLAHESYDNWYMVVSDNSGKIVMQFMKNRAN